MLLKFVYMQYHYGLRQNGILKKAFTRDRQTIPKWLANSHRLPQDAGRRNEGSAMSNRKDFLAKRSCLCSWHTGELMRWVGRCVVGNDVRELQRWDSVTLNATASRENQQMNK